MDRAYERYSLELRSVQILYSKSGKHNATWQRIELPEQAILKVEIDRVLTINDMANYINSLPHN